MNCPICGAENAPDTKFCVGCGSPLAEAAPAPVATYAEPAPVSEPAPASEGAKKLPIKPILFGLIGIVAVVLLISVIASLFSGGNGYTTYEKIINLVEVEDGEYSVVVGKKVLKPTIKSESRPSTDYSLDGSAMAFVTDEGELYVVSGTKVKQVKGAEDVVDFAISNNGKGVAFVSRGEDDEFGTLYLAKVSNGKSTKINDEVVGHRYGYLFEIAPDGKSVAYFKDGGDDADVLMFAKGKKSTKITDDEGASLLGLSNGGKQIYVVISDDDDTNLYSFNAKGKKSKIGSYGDRIRFNDDHTQVLYQNDESKSYISVKGKEGKKVRNGSLALVMVTDATTKDKTYPVSNLYNHLYSNVEGDIYMIKKNKDIKIVGNASNWTLDDSGKYLYYVHKGEELKVLKVSQGEKASEKAKTIIDDNFKNYIVTSDRKYVYFWDGEDLMSVNGKKGGNPKEITDELSGYSFAISSKDTLYYIVDGDLYAVSNGKKGKKVLSDVDSVYGLPYGDVYAEADGKLFATTGAKKLKQILELDD